MATPFRLKRSAVSGKRPTLNDLQLGELALNTYDGYLFAERDTGGVGIGTTITLLTPWIENFGAGSIYYNNNVGIGTTNPTVKLQLPGNSTNTADFKIGEFFIQNYSLNNTFFGNNAPWNGSSHTRSKTGSVELFQFFSGGFQIRLHPSDVAGTSIPENSNFKIKSTGEFGIGSSITGSHFDGSTFYHNSQGDVGIGTTLPTAKLDVNGTLNVTGISTFKDNVVFDSTNSIQIPVGVTTQRDPSPVAGQIRYNSELSSFEGYGPGNAWGSLGGVKDVNGDTYIKPEVSPGSNEDILYFYNAGSNTATISSTTTSINVDFSVAGVATFSQDVEVTGNLTVDGHTELDALRVSGISTFQGNVYLGDNDSLYFGDGNDLQIYHNGVDSYVSDIGEGSLILTGGRIIIKNATDTAKLIDAISGSSVDIYYNNSLKLQTTSTGIAITNGASTSATIAGPAELIIDPAAVGDNTGLVRIKGDLYVDGTTTQINSTSLEIADFIVGIASTATTDLLADGAGIKIGPDNTFLYEYNGGTNPSLKSSENLNVASGKVYQIAETERLSANTLSLGTGTTIHSSTSNLLSLGVAGGEKLRVSNSNVIVYENLGVKVTPASNTQVAIAGTLGISEVGGSGTRTLFSSSGGGFVLNHNDNSNITFQSQGSNRLSYNLSSDSWVIPATTETKLLVGTGATTGTANQKLQVTGGAYVSGSLGIGRTNPSVLLHLTGGSSIGAIVERNSTGESYIRYQNSSGTMHAGISTGATFWGIGDSTNFTTAPYFVVTNTTGNVGIKTTSPQSALDIRGTISIGRTDVAGINSIRSVVDINSWEYYGVSFSVSGQETAPTDIYFKDDGTKMYILGDTGNDVNEYALSTPWDVSTATFTTTYSVAAQETVPTGLYFKPDGTRMYICGQTGVSPTGDYARSYTLSTPWDISTASYDSILFNIGAQDTAPQGIYLKDDDGTKMYVVGSTNDNIYEYNLGTAWDISSATYNTFVAIGATNTQNLPLTLTSPLGIDFNASGTKMYIIDSTRDVVSRFDLSTPWDISTAIFFDNVYIGFQELSPTGVYYEEDQSKAYIVGGSNDTVYQFNTDVPSLELASSGISTRSSIILNNEARLNNRLYVTGRVDISSEAVIKQTLTADSTVNIAGTLSHTGTTATLNNTTSANTTNIATGAVGSNVVKTINVGTGGASNSRTLITLGSATAGAISTVTVPSPTDLLIGSATTTGTASQPLQVTGGAYVSGSVGIGTTNPSEKLDVRGNINVNDISVTGTATASLSTLTETAIHTALSASTYRSVEYTIQATQGSNYHSTKVLVVHDGSSAYHNEYGTVYNNSSVATFNADISGGNIRLLATGASSSSTVYKVYFVATKV